MKSVLKLTAVLILICHSTSYSQYYSPKNYKGLSLKIKDLKTVEKNGKTSYIVKAILTNHSRDTLFYFINANCEPYFYTVRKIYNRNDFKNGTLNDDNSISIGFEECGAFKMNVISLQPSGRRTVNLDIISQKPVTSSIKFFVSLSINKPKDGFPPDDLIQKSKKEILVSSNRIKIRRPTGTANKSK